MTQRLYGTFLSLHFQNSKLRFKTFPAYSCSLVDNDLLEKWPPETILKSKFSRFLQISLAERKIVKVYAKGKS